MEELKKLLNDPRTGLKESSDTNKTRYAILALFEEHEQAIRDLRDRWELKYHDSLKQYPECTWNSAIDEFLSDLRELLSN